MVKTPEITGDACRIEPTAYPATYTRPDVVCWACEESINTEAPAADVNGFLHQHGACNMPPPLPDELCIRD